MKKIFVCGGGALGSHFLLFGRPIEAEFSLVDDDRVETKNLASQWFVKPTLGKNKAAALKGQLHNFFGRRLTDFGVRLSEANVETLLGGQDLVVDCFDNAASRQLVQDFCRENGIACLHGGLAADGAFGVARWDRDFVIDAEDEPGQATCEGGEFLPLIVRVSAALVRSAQEWLESDGAVERNWNLSPNGAESFTA